MVELALIGLDGVNWKVLNNAVNKGLMPNFEELLEDSYTAELETTYPSVTGPAWTSIMTGDNPGRHGISDFLNHVEGGRPFTSSDIATETVYELVSESGDVALVNLPLSYPPKFRGEFVGSFLAPEDDFVRPRELESLLDNIGYKKNLTALEKSLNVVSSGIKSAETKSDLGKKLLGDQDLFFLLFSAPDWIMHNRYDSMEEGGADEAYKVFEVIDEFIGEVRGHSDNLILLSDHGFKSYEKCFHVNQWLKEEGYLETEGSMESFWLDNKFIEAAIDAAKSLEYSRKLVSRIYFSLEDFIPVPENTKVRLSSALSEGIDRENSEAFCPSSELAGIYLNDDRFEGLVETKKELKKEIMEGLPDSVSVIDGDEVYSGGEKDKTPDIVFSEERYLVSRGIYGKVFSSRSVNHHGRKGFLLAKGDNFNGNETAEHSIYDVAPTVAEFFELDLEADGDPIPFIEDSVSLGLMPDDY